MIKTLKTSYSRLTVNSFCLWHVASIKGFISTCPSDDLTLLADLLFSLDFFYHIQQPVVNVIFLSFSFWFFLCLPTDSRIYLLIPSSLPGCLSFS